MIYKKTINDGRKYFSDLLFYTFMQCGECGDKAYGDNLIRIRIVSSKPIDIETRPDDGLVQILFTTNTDSVYSVSLFHHEPADELNNELSVYGVNRLTVEDGVRLLEDYEETKKENTAFVRANVYIDLTKVTLHEYLNEGQCMCPSCENTEYITSSGIDLSISGNGYTNSKLREGYSDESDIGVNIDDASIMISYVDSNGNNVKAPGGDMLSTESIQRDFTNFLTYLGIREELREW